MLYDTIKSLREDAGYSQSQLAKKLDVTRSSVNAWEMGLSTPTTHYIVELAKLFHVSTDYILGLDSKRNIVLDSYNNSEIELIYNLLKYFDENKNK
jgi:transcriptional regulator with XRE-family HTH domain